MNATARPSQRFTTLDWIGTVVASFNAVGLLSLPVTGRSFASMFHDFGTGDHLPALTKLAISWWFPATLGALVLGGVVMGVRQPAPIQQRRAWIVGAFVLGGIGLAVCLIGMYLPIFAVADAIKAE